MPSKILGEYYVVFDKPAVQSIVEKFSAKGFMKNFNLFHDRQQKVNDVTIFNSFITDKAHGLNAPEPFNDITDGSWFISGKVNNPDVWKKVKDGTIKGFSIEGLFTYLPIKKNDEHAALRQIKFVLEDPNISRREAVSKVITFAWSLDGKKDSVGRRTNMAANSPARLTDSQVNRIYTEMKKVFIQG